MKLQKSNVLYTWGWAEKLATGQNMIPVGLQLTFVVSWVFFLYLFLVSTYKNINHV